MKIEKTKYPGWDQHPVYRVGSFSDYQSIRDWMDQNIVEHFLLSSGGLGYTFQVKSKHDWFMLKWL